MIYLLDNFFLSHGVIQCPGSYLHAPEYKAYCKKNRLDCNQSFFSIFPSSPAVQVPIVIGSNAEPQSLDFQSKINPRFRVGRNRVIGIVQDILFRQLLGGCLLKNQMIRSQKRSCCFCGSGLPTVDSC